MYTEEGWRQEEGSGLAAAAFCLPVGIGSSGLATEACCLTPTLALAGGRRMMQLAARRTWRPSVRARGSATGGARTLFLSFHFQRGRAAVDGYTTNSQPRVRYIGKVRSDPRRHISTS